METDELQLLRDRAEILELEAAYARTFDSHDGDGFAGLFTENGIYQCAHQPGMPAEPPTLRGRAALAAACTNFHGSVIHLMNVPQLTLDGDRAIGRIHFQVEGSYHDEYDNVHERQITGFYHSAYVRSDQGWKINNRVSVDYLVRTSVRSGYDGPAELPGPDF